MNTTPIINIIYQDRSKSDQYVLDMLTLMKSRKDLSSKDYHKKKLGKQKYCWTGFIRHWVWETDTWRVYVSSEGASFEVLEKSSIDEAWAAWQDYFGKLK